MDLMVWKYRFDKKDMSNKLMISESNRKMVEFCRSAVKGHVWKESRIAIQGRREVKVAILLLDNDKNVTAENVKVVFIF